MREDSTPQPNPIFQPQKILCTLLPNLSTKHFKTIGFLTWGCCNRTGSQVLMIKSYVCLWKYEHFICSLVKSPYPNCCTSIVKETLCKVSWDSFNLKAFLIVSSFLVKTPLALFLFSILDRRGEKLHSHLSSSDSRVHQKHLRVK